MTLAREMDSRKRLQRKGKRKYILEKVSHSKSFNNKKEIAPIDKNKKHPKSYRQPLDSFTKTHI